ncbi:MAG: LacI family DNA-binding transcriptional regulator [Angustibacter sp.]
MPTIYDVAERSGVSHTTVSKVYRAPERVSAATRERVLAAARDLGFAGPSRLAAGLRTGRAGVIGVVLGESTSYALTDPAAIAFLRGVAAEPIAGDGLTVLPATGPGPAGDPVTRAAVDGLLVYSVLIDNLALAAARRRGLPRVLVDTPARRGEHWVGIDDRAAARCAAEHLARSGHQRVAVLADWFTEDREPGPVDPTADLPGGVAAERLAGYLSVFPDATVYVGGVNGEVAGHRATLDLLRVPARRRPTAVLAMSDELALGGLRAAAELGLAVPEQLSVVGFDDGANAQARGLTTVRQPLLDKGRVAASVLAELIAGRRPRPVRRLLPTELVVRGTTGPRR